jgi:DNA-binding LytR/AlgR family response regulator
MLGSFANMVQAKQTLTGNNVDVLIGDIKILDRVNKLAPNSNGKVPEIVVVATDEAGACKAYESEATDTPVWPVSFDRFLKMKEKVERKLADSKPPQYCFVKTDSTFTKIEYDKICYVQGMENYVRIYCENKTVLTLSTMKNIETSLAAYHFLRIHRSYIVNLDKVDSIFDYNFQVGKKVLPVGKSYRKSISELIKSTFTFQGR